MILRVNGNTFLKMAQYSSAGEFDKGKKDGYWKAFTSTGKLKSEVTYDKGSGEYREYYESGKLKLKGRIVEGKRQGKWEFFYEDGKKEGTCEYDKGKGTYYGYYP